MYDAAGRRIALRVEERRRPRGALRRALRLPSRKTTEIVWSLEEVSDDERERVARLLAVGLGLQPDATWEQIAATDRVDIR